MTPLSATSVHCWTTTTCDVPNTLQTVMIRSSDEPAEMMSLGLSCSSTGQWIIQVALAETIGLALLRKVELFVVLGVFEQVERAGHRVQERTAQL